MKTRILLYLALVCGLAAFMFSGACGSQKDFSTVLHSGEYSDVAKDLAKHVHYLSVDCHPRSLHHPENQEKAARYIEDILKAAGAEVSRQIVPVKERNFVNIIAQFPGRKKETIVVGAHYDSYEDTPGADDNASAVAGLLELGRKLQKYNNRGYTIELVAFCNEEPPFFRSGDMGSAHHVRHAKREKKKIIGMICLEMIGYFTDESGSQEYPLESFKNAYPETGNFLAVVGNFNSMSLTGIVRKNMARNCSYPIVSLVFPNIGGLSLDFSDHRSYWNAGIPAVMVTDTAFYRNREYHKPGDTWDRLDYQKMDMAVQGIFEAVKAIDMRGNTLP